MAIPSNIDVFVSFQAGSIPSFREMAAGPFGFLFGLGIENNLILMHNF